MIESGEGPPVVHLHGNNTSSLSHLMLLEHYQGCVPILVDRPGFGLSDPETFPVEHFGAARSSSSTRSSTSSGWSQL